MKTKLTKLTLPAAICVLGLASQGCSLANAYAVPRLQVMPEDWGEGPGSEADRACAPEPEEPGESVVSDDLGEG